MSQWAPPGQYGTLPPPPPAPPAPRRGRGAIIAVIIGLVVVVLAVGATLVLTGAFDRDDDRDWSTTARSTTPPPDPTAEPSEPEKTEEPVEEIPGETIGTSENPYSPGDSFTIMKYWTFTLSATDTDAWPEVAAQYEGQTDVDQYQPAPGTVFVLAPLEMAYTGPPDAPEGAEIGMFYFIAPDGTKIHKPCGRYATTFDIFEEDLIEKKISESAPICVQATPEEAASGQWELNLYTYDENGKEHLVKVYYSTS